MNSPIAELFLHIQAKIATLTTIIDGVVQPCFRYIDQDLGQLDAAGGRYAVSWPCALIDIDDFIYTAISQNCQLASGKVVIRIGFPPLSGSHGSAPEAYRERAIFYYELEHILHHAVHGWKPANEYAADAIPVPLQGFGGLNRIASKTARRKDNVRVREVTYAIAFEDYTTAPTRLTTGLPANIVMDTGMPLATPLPTPEPPSGDTGSTSGTGGSIG